MTKPKIPLLVKIAEALFACFVGFAVAEITPPFVSRPSLTKITLICGIVVLLTTAILALHMRKPWARPYAAILLCVYALLSIIGVFVAVHRYQSILSTSLKGAPIFGFVLWSSILLVGLGLLISKKVRGYFDETI